MEGFDEFEKENETLEKLLSKSLHCITLYYKLTPGPGCSKLKTWSVNLLLRFQMLISDICQYFC